MSDETISKERVATEPAAKESEATLALRGALGGVLMGLANLVPGISGGTMLLAAGVYTHFVDAIAEVTTLRFRRSSLIVLASIVVAAALGIVLLAGPTKTLVVHHRWVMYSLFIGLTLGGVPLIWRLARPAKAGFWIATAIALALMSLLAWSQAGASSADAGGSFLGLALAGLAGASAMILPGLSGGYLLLLLGQYVPILAAIDAFRAALGSGELRAALEIGWAVGAPVGLGVVVGVVAISNLLRWALRSARAATLGLLMGLLLGAVLGLWPFREPVAPSLGDVVKGQTVTEANLAEIEIDDYPTSPFSPTGSQVGLSLLLVAGGLLVTWGVSRIGPQTTDGD